MRARVPTPSGITSVKVEDGERQAVRYIQGRSVVERVEEIRFVESPVIGGNHPHGFDVVPEKIRVGARGLAEEEGYGPDHDAPDRGTGEGLERPVEWFEPGVDPRLLQDQRDGEAHRARGIRRGQGHARVVECRARGKDDGPGRSPLALGPESGAARNDRGRPYDREHHSYRR